VTDKYGIVDPIAEPCANTIKASSASCGCAKIWRIDWNTGYELNLHCGRKRTARPADNAPAI
jgi:hypothetical protein